MRKRDAVRRGSALWTASVALGLTAAAPAAADGLIDDLTGGLTGGGVPPLCLLPTDTGCTVQTGVTSPGVDPSTATTPTTGEPNTDASAVPGGGSGTGGGGASSRADKRAPRLRLAARRGRLSVSLVRGYTLKVTCDEACSITGSATRAGRRSTIARGRARLTRAGKAKLKLRFTRRASRTLRHRARAKVTIRVTVTDTAGNRAKRRVSVTLKG